jgi:ferredoxin
MDFEIRVHRPTCIGSGQCVHWAPGVFDQDDDAISVVVDPRGEPEHLIVRAVTACPVGAITLHAGGSTLGPRDFTDWTLGTDAEDPLVPRLLQLSEEHHELLEALHAATGGDGGGVEAIHSMAKAHLRVEGQTYAQMGRLVDPRLVDAFRSGHHDIDGMLDDALSRTSDAIASERVLADLRPVVAEHIRAEEAVLFPAVLSALHGASIS